MPNINQSKLTTLEQLRIDNRTLPAPSAPIKYNEVYGPVTADALVGIFVRSTKHRHLLFGMGVRAMVLRMQDQQEGPREVARHQVPARRQQGPRLR